MLAKLHFKNGPLAGRTMELADGSFSVGRKPDNDIPIDDPSISGHHCQMDFSQLGMVVQDLGSTNGCYLNGEPFHRESLPRTSVLGLGTVLIEVELPEVNIAVPDMTPPPPPEPNFLSDGSNACRHHPDAAASLYCVKCGETWCLDCVRQVGLAGGKNVLRFCAVCDGKCENLEPVSRKAIPSLLGKLKGALGLTSGGGK